MPSLSDHELARELAIGAGQLLVTARANTGYADPKALKDHGDAISHEWLMTQLAATRPQDAVLSEEGADDKARLSAERVWIVDPLDGTREFGEEGRDDWAVHVALWEKGELVAGAVDRPAAGRCFATSDIAAPTTSIPERVRLAVSRSRPPAFVTELAARLDAELVPMGSAGVKAMSVVEGVSDAYVHAGGQYEWDSAAPVAVARAAGLYTSRLDGSPLHYNNDDPYLPDLVIARPEVAEQVMAAISELSAGA